MLTEGNEEPNQKNEEKEEKQKRKEKDVQRAAYAACDRSASQATSNGLSGQAWLTTGLAIHFCDDPWKEIRAAHSRLQSCLLGHYTLYFLSR
jgi:hypothetical protein